MLRLRQLQRLIIREISSKPIGKVTEDPEEAFGTLSRSGSKALTVHSTERYYAEDKDGYDEESFDLAPRKNAFYYKYEISKYARQGSLGIRKALELFQTMKSHGRLTPDINNFSPLIYGCAKSGYTKRAFELYHEYRKYYSRTPHSIVTSLINACAECPFPEYGVERLSWLRTHLRIEQNRDLNIIQYNCMIKAYGKLGQLTEASKVVKEMIDNKIYPQLDTFNALLVGCVSDKESGCAIALRVFKRMRLYDLKPDLDTYNLLLRCIRECGMGPPELMNQTLKELPAMTNINQRLFYKRKSMRRSPNSRNSDQFEWMPLLSDMSHSIDVALSEPASDSKLSEVKLIEDESKSSELLMMPTNHPEDSLIANYQVQHTSTNLPNLLSDDHLELSYRVQAIQYEKLKTASARLLLFGGIHGYLESMVRDGCKPNHKTFSFLVTCIGNTLKIKEFLRLSDDYSITRDALFYTLLIRQICSIDKNPRRLESARELLENMRQDNIRPDILTFEAFALGCDSIKTADRLLKDVKNCGFVESQRLLHNLFKCAIVKSNFGLLQFLIKSSYRFNYKPTKATVDKLEELRLSAHDLALKIEKGLIKEGDIPEWCDENFVGDYDQFSSSFNRWLKDIDIQEAEEEHPWQNFQVKTGSKRDGFVEFEKTFRALTHKKREAIKQGTGMGILIKDLEAEKIQNNPPVIQTRRSGAESNGLGCSSCSEQ